MTFMGYQAPLERGS